MKKKLIPSGYLAEEQINFFWLLKLFNVAINLKGVRIHDQALVKVLWPMHGTLHAILKSRM